MHPSRSWVRSHIGMVLQEPFLFSRTIAENIGITRRNMELSDIRWAASIACVACGIRKLISERIGVSA